MKRRAATSGDSTQRPQDQDVPASRAPSAAAAHTALSGSTDSTGLAAAPKSIPTKSSPRSVPSKPPRWSYPVQAAVGITVTVLYFAGVASTVPGVLALLQWLPLPWVATFARQYDSVVQGLSGSHDAAANSSKPLSRTLLITHDPSADWSGLWSHFSGNGSVESASLPPGSSYTLPNWIDRAVPLFLVSLAVELAVALAQQRRTEAAAKANPDAGIDTRPLFRLNDSINSVSLGMLQQMHHLSTWVRPLIYAPYIWLWEHYALVRLPVTWWSWIVAFLLIELGYYWMHRLGHECTLFWAAHVAHHSSEEYNLTTALRQGAIQYSCSWIFNLPAALLIPPPLFSFHQHLNRVYQFFIHTRVVRRMHPVVEWTFNTPSHHRAHHGSNPEYIDCNYGGTLIVFDRLFGTFVAEGTAAEPVVYGLTHNLRSWDPIKANTHVWSYMLRSSAVRRGWRRLEVLWQRPGWNAADGTLYPVPLARPHAPRFDLMAVRGTWPLAYLVASMLTNVVVLNFLVKSAASPSHAPLTYALSAYVVLCVSSIGMLMEGRWGWTRLLALDAARLALGGVALVAALTDAEIGAGLQFKPVVSVVSSKLLLLLACSAGVCRSASAVGAELQAAAVASKQKQKQASIACS